MEGSSISLDPDLFFFYWIVTTVEKENCDREVDVERKDGEELPTPIRAMLRQKNLLHKIQIYRTKPTQTKSKSHPLLNQVHPS